jgi:hypothetical protein
LTEIATLNLFGEVYRNLSDEGIDHPNIRNFAKYGWSKIEFNEGLAITLKT